MAVTGVLALYGQVPGTTWTRLLSSAKKGSSSMEVESASHWEVGGELVIGPSFSDPQQSEYVTITTISNTSVGFDPPLKHDHYGSPSDRLGKVDSRTAVGSLTRNIKIMAGDRGFRMLVYGYQECGNEKYGRVTLEGVEIQNRG